jgi:hypothetical protein
MEIRPAGAELFHAERGTYNEANIRLSQFFKGHKNIAACAGGSFYPHQNTATVICYRGGRIRSVP